MTHELFASISRCEEPRCREYRSGSRKRPAIQVFLFTSERQSSDITMRYDDHSEFVQLGKTWTVECEHCGCKYEYARKCKEGRVMIDVEKFRMGKCFYIRLSSHKYVDIQTADEIFRSIVSGGASFLKASEAFNRSKCQTLAEKIFPWTSGLLNAEKLKMVAPSQAQSIGKTGLSATLEPDDVEACFWLWIAFLRSWRTGETIISYEVGSRSTETPFRGLVQVLLDDFKVRGLFESSTHACTDCSFFVPQETSSSENGRHIVQAVLIDGVSVTTPVCVKNGCCQELENQRSHRFCQNHIKLHAYCGVQSGPGLTTPCHNFVNGLSSESGITVTNVPRNVAYSEHSEVEKVWRQEQLSKPEFIVALRAARSRGRKRKISNVTRLINPDHSDHCKGEWEAGENFMPTRDNIMEYTVDFKRKYAYVYCVICRPCGMVIAGKFFSDAESPTEVVKFVSEVFPRKDCMPNAILFDAACKVAKSISRGKLSSYQEMFRNSVWLVPPIHHKQSDEFCQTNCKVSNYKEFMSPSHSQRWNGTVCEQLFSRLGRREPSISSMKKSNAELFFLVLLEEHNYYLYAERVCRAFKMHGEDGERVSKKRKYASIPRGSLQ